MYEDLFFAVKKHLLQCGRNLTTNTLYECYKCKP